MKKKEALKFFNNSRSELADALKIFPEAVSQWGKVIPELRAHQLEKITNGVLRVGNCYKKSSRKTK